MNCSRTKVSTLERVDLYQDRFVNTEQSIIRGTPEKKDAYTMAVFACIFHSDGKMLIQRRQKSKKSWPGMWDVSVGGAVTSGETSLTAVQREIAEELGIQVKEENLTKLLALYYDRMIHDFYSVEMDLALSDLKLQEEEVMDAKWASCEEINQMIADGSFIPVYGEFIDLLFRMKTKRGILA